MTAYSVLYKFGVQEMIMQKLNGNYTILTIMDKYSNVIDKFNVPTTIDAELYCWENPGTGFGMRYFAAIQKMENRNDQ